MAWYDENGKEEDVVLSSRVRFARNIAEYPFPPRLSDKAAEEIINRVGDCLPDYEKIDFSKISQTEAKAYVEKHLCSAEFASESFPHAMFIADDGKSAIMVCEEDHLREQRILPGLAIREAYEKLSDIDRALDGRLNFAFDEKLGYLTHCPTNLGTGMRASVMMFLPALTMSDRISTLAAQLAKIGLTIRGLFGEGTAAEGCIYQISNQVTLGITEADTITKLCDITAQLIDEERRIRNTIKGDIYDKLEDRICRSEGVLRCARLLSAADFIAQSTNIRLGAALGIVDGISYQTLNTLLVETMPANLVLAEFRDSQKYPVENERDKARAAMVRKAFAQA